MRHLLLIFTIAFLFSCGSDTESLTPEEYINQNNLVATELENGVFIIIHDQGNDVKPAIDDVVQVKLVGKLTDETEVDRNDDIKYLLSDIIPGWFIGLKEIGEGGSCTMIIPHAMGFGNFASGTIPAKSTLIYDVDLKNVFSTLSLDEYITENDLETEELEKGVHIVVHTEGNEKRPTLASEVTGNYTGKLTNELVFDEGENVKFKLAELIEGWQIGLLELGEGGSCTLVLPASVGYGSNVGGSIPPNSPLIFEIDLIKID